MQLPIIATQNLANSVKTDSPSRTVSGTGSFKENLTTAVNRQNNTKTADSKAKTAGSNTSAKKSSTETTSDKTASAESLPSTPGLPTIPATLDGSIPKLAGHDSGLASEWNSDLGDHSEVNSADAMLALVNATGDIHRPLAALVQGSTSVLTSDSSPERALRSDLGLPAATQTKLQNELVMSADGSLKAEGAGTFTDTLAQKTKDAAEVATSAILPTQTLIASTTDVKHVNLEVAPRFNSPQWGGAFSQKISWMVADSIQSATLTLNPPDLGPVQVVLSVSNDQATATFSSAQPEVRQALENELPKLREMLGASGISLGEASVNSGFSNQHNQESSTHSARASATQNIHSTMSANEEEPITAGKVTAGSGLINTFA